MQLYDYQITAVSAALSALSTTARALINLATGLGKTVVMREVSKSFSKRILFLCHDTDILEQNLKKFEEFYDIEGELGLYYGRDKTGSKDRFVFATFQTMLNNLKRFNSNTFCLMMVDECHHGPAPTFKEVIDHFECPKLGASATIERMDGMKVEDIFGEPVISIGLAEGIAKGYLTPFEYKVMSDDLSLDLLDEIVGEADKNRQLTVGDVNKRLFIKKRDEEIVALIKEEVGTRKTLVFCRNIDHAIQISGLLNVGHIDRVAAAYHSGLFSDLLDERLNDFRDGDLQYLVVINKANEGIDIPDMEAVVFLRATESKLMFTQQLGRALRKFAGKELVKVLDFAGSLERLSMLQHFVWSVHDEYGKGSGNGMDGYDREENLGVIHVSGMGFDFVFSTEVVEALKLLSKLKNDFYPYTEAHAKVKELGINIQEDYKNQYIKDPRLPSDPRQTYSDDWVSWPSFFGREPMRRRYDVVYPFTEARRVARKLKFKSAKDYLSRYKEADSKLPSAPDTIYGSDWISWPDFLAIRDRTNLYETYDKAQKAAQTLGFASITEYQKDRHQDTKLPASPRISYPDEWSGWTEFLGVKKKTLDYPDAKVMVRKNKIKSSVDYRVFRKSYSELPAFPHRIYDGKGWEGWDEFLGRK
jgi:superfamily II DNA or RNA helicase